MTWNLLVLVSTLVLFLVPLAAAGWLIHRVWSRYQFRTHPDGRRTADACTFAFAGLVVWCLSAIVGLATRPMAQILLVCGSGLVLIGGSVFVWHYLKQITFCLLLESDRAFTFAARFGKNRRQLRERSIPGVSRRRILRFILPKRRKIRVKHLPLPSREHTERPG